MRGGAAALLLVAACLGGGAADAPDSVARDGGDGDGLALARDGGGVAGSVTCGVLTCDLGAGQVCCRIAQACLAECDGEQPFRCDGPEDCEGNPCCAVVNQVPLGSECGTVSACDLGTPLCHGTGDCPSGQQCCPGVFVTGYCADGC